MILDFFADLNWLAVLVAAVAWFAFSAIWYSVPPISKAWQAATRVDMNVEGPPLAMLFILTFIGYFVTTVVIALIVRGIGADDFGDGLALGITLGVGFGLVSATIVQMYEQKGANYGLINGVNTIISYSIVSVILAVWA